MNKIYKTGHMLTNATDLRLRAEDRLKNELMAANLLQQHEVVQKLYDLRLKQIEIELLSDEFNRFRKAFSPDTNKKYEQFSYGDCYFFLDREGDICDASFFYANRNKAGIHYFPAATLVKCISYECRAAFYALLQDVFKSDEKKSCELIFDSAGGKKYLGYALPQYASISAVSDDEKLFCLFVVKDNSARKISENREKESRAALGMLEKTIAASRNEIFMFDASTLYFTFANQRALENLGYTIDELKCMKQMDIQDHAYNQEMEEAVTYLVNHKNSVRKLNSVHLRKDGSMYPVEIYLQLFEQENVNNFIAIILDVSNQRAVESQLKSIVESAGAIIWASDTNGVLSFISNQILEILGINADQLLGHSLTELFDHGFFHQEDMDTLLDGFKKVLKNGVKISNLRYRAKHTDGSWRWLSMNMTPNRSVDGQICQIVGVMHDINAQKLAEDALLQLNQELDLRVSEEIQKNKEKDLQLQRQSRLAGMGEMIGNIAHQWRQPINSLSLILSDLEDATLYGECDRIYMETAIGKSKQIIQKMSSTIDDFRHFFRVDKRLGVFSLLKVTGECLNIVEAAMKYSNINIIVKCDHDVEVNGYFNEYSQAVMNILSNAREAILERKITHGEILIEIGEEGGYGVHTVTDNGGGIPADIMPRIFEPHFTTKESGVGIGLYMALVSIEKNINGRITAENVANGARFTMYIPKPGAGEQYVTH